MQTVIGEILSKEEELIKVTFSAPEKEAEFVRILLRPVRLKNADWQAERFVGTKVFHLNLKREELSGFLSDTVPLYGQITLTMNGVTVNFVKRGARYKRSQSGNSLSAVQKRGNDREKEYLLKEGERIPALVDLGIFTQDFKLKAGKQDKYKQINRFVEIVDDVLGKKDLKEFTLVDFGCGKSYLTFILYYYLTVKRGLKATVRFKGGRGKLLQRDREPLRLRRTEILRERRNEGEAVRGRRGRGDFSSRLRRRHRLCVGICRPQKYQIYFLRSLLSARSQFFYRKGGGDFDLLLKHGLFQERFSALLTDAVRAEILKQCGYRVDVLEFVDFSHSPKNIMLRAEKTSSGKGDFSAVEELMKKYSFRQTLFQLIKEDRAKK